MILVSTLVQGIQQWRFCLRLVDKWHEADSLDGSLAGAFLHIEVVKRTQVALEVLLRRWVVVERTFYWLRRYSHSRQITIVS